MQNEEPSGSDEIRDRVKKEADRIKKAVAGKIEETREWSDEAKAEFEKSTGDMQENLRKAGDTISESGFWEETGENISESAKEVGGQARRIAEKISAYSEQLFGKIKDRSSEAFKSGLDLTRDGVNSAQAAADELRDNYEVRKLNRHKKDIAGQLGMKFYLEIKNNDNMVPEDILKKRVFISLLKELEDIDKQILDIKNEKN